MSVDARIRQGLTMINNELPVVDTAEEFQHLERDIRRDTRRRRALVGAVAAAAVLVITASAVLLNRDGPDKVRPAPEPVRPQRMVMFDQHGLITYIKSDGSRQTLAVKDVSRLAPSPDGQQIAYITDSNSGNTLWIADADGTDLRRIPNACRGCQPGYGLAWSHDGTRLAYAEFTPGQRPSQLRIRTLATGHEQVFRMPAGGDARGPMFSPDDHTLVINAGGVYVATMDPSKGMSSWTPLTLNYHQVQAPSWSEDGQTIYYTATTRGDNTNDPSASIDLYAVNADGTHPRQITHAGPGERYFAASVDGDRFLISRVVGNAPWQVGWLNADGTTFTPIPDRDGRPILGNAAIAMR